MAEKLQIAIYWGAACGGCDVSIIDTNGGFGVACCGTGVPAGLPEQAFPGEPLLQMGWEVMLPAESLDGGANLIHAYAYVPESGKAYALEGAFTAEVCHRGGPPPAVDCPE